LDSQPLRISSTSSAVWLLLLLLLLLLLFSRNQTFYCFLDCTHQIRFKSRGEAIVGLEISWTVGGPKWNHASYMCGYQEQKWNKSVLVIDFHAASLLAPTSTESHDVEDRWLGRSLCNLSINDSKSQLLLINSYLFMCTVISCVYSSWNFKILYLIRRDLTTNVSLE
jgi:hypothetical protein